MWHIVNISIILFLAVSNIFGQSEALERFLTHANLKNAQIGISVINLKTGEKVTAHRDHKNIIPASTQKVLLAALLDSKEYLPKKIETVLLHDGIITERTLHGNVYIHGNGDPSWQSQYEYKDHTPWYTQWINILQENNIDCINGSIYWISGDDDYGPNDKWSWQDIGNYYGAGAYPVHFMDNSYEIHWDVNGPVGAEAKIIKTVPSTYQNLIQHSVQVGKKRSGDQSYIYAAPNAPTEIIKGTIGKQSTVKITKGSIDNPSFWAHDFIIRVMADSLLHVQNDYNELQEVDTSWNVLGTIQSPVIKDILKHLLFKSDNTLSESLKGFLERSETKNYNTLFQEQFIAEDKVYILDASGLSRNNAITPRLLSQVYQTNPGIWKDLLITPGEGSLRNLFKGLPQPYTLKAKSGSMGGVRGYTGIIYKGGSAMYGFTIIVNHFEGSGYRVAQQIDEYLTDLLKEMR